MVGVMGSSMLHELCCRVHSPFTTVHAFITLALLLLVKWGGGRLISYPPANLAAELCLLILLVLVERCRLLLARRGNLTRRPLPSAVALALTAPSLLAVCYFLLWQTVVLHVEVVLCAVQMALIAVESGCTVTVMVSAWKQ